MKRLFTLFVNTALISRVTSEKQVNVGANYGERFGSPLFADN